MVSNYKRIPINELLLKRCNKKAEKTGLHFNSDSELVRYALRRQYLGGVENDRE